MRNSTTFIATSVSLLILSFAAQAAPTVEVLWHLTGTPYVLRPPGSTVVADFYITLSGSDALDGYQFSVGWDTGVLSYVPGSLVNAGPTPPGDWTPTGFDGALLGEGKLEGALAAVSTTPLSAPVERVYIGSLSFSINFPDFDFFPDVWVYDTGAFGTDYAAIGSSVYTNTTFFGAYIAPEPATASLLGLGLFALAAASRRRRRPNGSS